MNYPLGSPPPIPASARRNSTNATETLDGQFDSVLIVLDESDLLNDDSGKIPYVLGHGRRTRRTLTVHLAFSFGAIALMVGTVLSRGIPVPLAVVGHEGTTVLVTLNGLRLLGRRE